MVQYFLIMRNFRTLSFLAFFTLLNILVVSAFSLKGMFFGSTPKTEPNKEENLQSLRVFEPNRTYAEEELVMNKNLAKSETTSFDSTDNILVDAGEVEASHNVTDDAVYTVQAGESIYSIASYFGVSVDTIVSYNGLTSKVVREGQVLEVPTTSGIMYKIKKGDTLESIATKYAISADDVSLYNGLLAADNLTINEEIFLPGAKIPEEKKKSPIGNGKVGITSITSKVISPSTQKWVRGDTSHLNTSSDIRKYSSLPQYAGYYTNPAPGTTRTQKMHGHNAVDLAGRLGTPILASAGGTVRVAKTGGYNFGYGNYIILTHPNGSETIYAHLSGVQVTPGQTVDKGEQIGRLGSTGNSTGPHLHFEIRGAYNPFAW